MDPAWIPHLELRAGYTGSFWSPKGIEPYQVNTYGRSMAYAELAVVHPLLVVSEALDFIEIPCAPDTGRKYLGFPEHSQRLQDHREPVCVAALICYPPLKTLWNEE